jgi:malate dehydrogenase (oxaloacetate-decarboxylating)
MPVMEGKALLLERLAGISGVPVLVDTRDPKEFVDAVVRIAPSFGAVNLEDVAAPDCFEIEARIQEALDIPVMHDDQHGTAVVVLASVLRACALTGLTLADQTLGIVGLGAAGIGISKLLLSYGIKHLIGTDLKDEAMARLEQAGGQRDTLQGVMAHADIVVATTGAPGLIKPSMIRQGQVILSPFQSQSRDPAGRCPGGRSGVCHGRENREQRPGLSRHLPGRPGCPGSPDHRRHEDRGCEGDRRPGPGG